MRTEVLNVWRTVCELNSKPTRRFFLPRSGIKEDYMKKILLVSCLCSPNILEYLFRTAPQKPALSVQKFHRLLAEGLAMHKESCCIETLSAIPVTPASHKRRIWRLPSEAVGNIGYNYAPTINLPIVKNILVSIGAFFKAISWVLRGGRKDKVLICDVLNVSASSAAMFAGKLTRTKVVAIVTDLPNLIVGGSRDSGLRRGIHNKLTSMLMSNYDGYILLTEQMNQVVNVRSKPHLVMEGLVDVNMAAAENLFENKSPETVIIYAGGIYEKYGVKKLIDAFMLLQGDDLRLHIYGPGEMAKDMPGYTKLDRRIVYYGIVPNKEVVEKEMEATLLINPRSSTEELAKYSFPSKNMEYMVSGTPLLTTPLPGMPQEYYPFVYVFNDETVEGFYQTLKTLLSKPKEELHEFGQQAKQFVLTCKGNNVQAKQILAFVEKISR
jgi:glycosyltransferase involved in cell wall biosynthesis